MAGAAVALVQRNGGVDKPGSLSLCDVHKESL